MKVFVDANFRKYIGKMYHTDDEPFILFAFEKGTSDLKALEDEFGSSVSSVEKTTLS